MGAGKMHTDKVDSDIHQLMADAANMREPLGLELLDHVVMGRGRFASLIKRGVVGAPLDTRTIRFRRIDTA